MSQPRLIETSASVSQGAKIQVKKYEISGDFYFNMGKKWAVPDDWTEEQADQFRCDKTRELQDQVEAFANIEVEKLLEQKNDLNS